MMSAIHNTQPLFQDVSNEKRFYQVMITAERNDDGVEMVVYRGLDTLNKFWVMPSSEFYDGRFRAV